MRPTKSLQTPKTDSKSHLLSFLRRQESICGNSERYLEALRTGQDYTDSLPAIETWLREADKTLKSKKEERKFTAMKNYFSVNKKRLAYAFAALLLLVGACNLPVTEHQTLGHVLTWSLDKENTDAAAQINNLNWLKDGQLSVSENNNNGKVELLYTAMLPGSTEDQVFNYRKDLERIKGITSVNLFPLSEDVKRPLYSAALHKLFRVDVNATNMSDEEVQKELDEQFRKAGIENPGIVFSRDENGKTHLEMKLEESGLKNGTYEVRVHDGQNEDVLKMKKIDSGKDQFEGKTDDEIRQMVKEENKEANLQDSDIQIIREDGKIKVKVVKEVEK